MSIAMLRSSAKPPLARSPIRLRPRRTTLQPTISKSAQTPTGKASSLVKPKEPNRNCDVKKLDFRLEYQTMSCEFKALEKIVHQEFGTRDVYLVEDGVLEAKKSPLFRRGRFYDEYSARRNERLKRKKGEIDGYYEKKSPYALGVRVESAKKRDSSKLETWRKATTVAATPVAERREARTPRYSLRSVANKENKKPPLSIMMSTSLEKSVGITERKVESRRVKRT